MGVILHERFPHARTKKSTLHHIIRRLEPSMLMSCANTQYIKDRVNPCCLRMYWIAENLIILP